MGERRSNDIAIGEINSKVDSLKELFETKLQYFIDSVDKGFKAVDNGFKGVHERQDKTNGNVIKNTEFRQQTEGVVKLFQWIGFSWIVFIIVTIGMAVAVGTGIVNPVKAELNSTQLEDIKRDIQKSISTDIENGVFEIDIKNN